ncbi:MAG: diaminopimelate decarboxylase [Candidatus Eisenbacteria bacterium]
MSLPSPANAATDPRVLSQAHAALNVITPGSRAFWFSDTDAMAARARVLVEALAPLSPRIAYALKANGLPCVARVMREAGLHADAGSLGELELARSAGFDAAHRTLSGNGRTPEEAAWVAEHGVACVSVDQPGELDLLQRAAAARDVRIEVALRANPGILAGGHRHIATGHSHSKFGMSVKQALEAFASGSRWPHLGVRGLHLHVGSQIDSAAPLIAAARLALELAAESARAGAPLTSINLGGGFAVDYAGQGGELDLAGYARAIAALPGASSVRWCFEPGRWLVAPAGALVTEVLWDKSRDDPDGTHRFVVLAAGMNDLLRPALYGARHRVLVLATARADDAGVIVAGPAEHSTSAAPAGWSPADIVGPVCESSDLFATSVPLPPLASGALLALLDTGAYGSTMSSNYNGRGRLAEVAQVKGELVLARAAESVRVRLDGEHERPLDSPATRQKAVPR